MDTAERQRQVAQLHSEGLSTREIATRLGISRETARRDVKAASDPSGTGQEADVGDSGGDVSPHPRSEAQEADTSPDHSLDTLLKGTQPPPDLPVMKDHYNNAQKLLTLLAGTRVIDRHLDIVRSSDLRTATLAALLSPDTMLDAAARLEAAAGKLDEVAARVRAVAEEQIGERVVV